MIEPTVVAVKFTFVVLHHLQTVNLSYYGKFLNFLYNFENQVQIELRGVSVDLLY